MSRRLLRCFLLVKDKVVSASDCEDMAPPKGYATPEEHLYCKKYFPFFLFYF